MCFNPLVHVHLQSQFGKLSPFKLGKVSRSSCCWTKLVYNSVVCLLADVSCQSVAYRYLVMQLLHFLSVSYASYKLSMVQSCGPT